MALVVLAAFGALQMHSALAANCSQPCPSDVCDDVTGACVLEVGSGQGNPIPAVTPRGCPRGQHGAGCTLRCPEHCLNNTCARSNGRCSLGCKAGKKGPMCKRGCGKGFYGENCAMPCSQHCKRKACHARSGECTKGCVKGHWGSDCSLGAQFNRSSPLARQEFYNQLSAEGKSVLLFLLTSEYDHALARAQFEIERAIEDRNRIQQLIQQ